MYEVKIYGEITNFEDPLAFEYGYCGLSHVQNQLRKARGKPILVRVNSYGGDCTIGFAIYHELRRYAKKNNVEIWTLGEGNVCSIATIIFLAGDKRTLTETTSPFVHNAWTYAEGNSGVMLKEAQVLSEWDNLIAKHYSDHTDLTIDEAKELMHAETSITPSMALSMRFCTEVEDVLRPKALKRFESNINKNNRMAKDTKPQSWVAKALAALKSSKQSVTNKLVMTADETEIDFFELADEDTPEIGDLAQVDGVDAEGEYVMKTGETYVFVAGELTEIVAAEADLSPEDSKALIADLTAQLEAATASLAKERQTIKALKETVSKQPENKTREREPKKDAAAPPARGSRAAEALKKAKENEELKNKK